MKCSKCGNILDEKELYCSKCGLININNPNNKVIKDMAQECIKEDLKKQTKLRKFLKYINDSKKILIITNIIFYIISVILYIKNVHNTFDTWFNVFIISFIYFYIICFEVIFKKRLLVRIVFLFPYLTYIYFLN